MEGSSQKRPEEVRIFGVDPLSGYGDGYKALLRPHYTAINDAKEFLKKLQHLNPELQTQAVKKIIVEQKEIIKVAENEIDKIQKENEKKITKHMN